MSIRRRLGALAMTMMLPLGGATFVSVMVVSSATPALAGAGGDKHKGHATPHDCWDTGCNGLDPQTTGCASSAYTVFTTPIKDSGGTQLGNVELRYSKNCGSNWSRVTAFSQFAGALIADVYNNLGQHSGTDYQNGTLAYSYMLGGAAELDWACGNIIWEGSGGYACTPQG